MIGEVVQGEEDARKTSSTGASSEASQREPQKASQSNPRPASSFRPSSVAVAAPLVKSSTQCGETKAIFRNFLPSPSGRGPG